MPAQVIHLRRPDPIAAACKCGRRYTERQWARRRYVGYFEMPDGGGGTLELRDCICGSTLARTLPGSRDRRRRTVGRAALVCLAACVHVLVLVWVVL